MTILPNAEVTRVSLDGGFPMPHWFDLYVLTENTRDDVAGIMKAMERVHRIIDDAIDAINQSVPPERIILGDFSKGGALALTAGLTSNKKVVGIIALTTRLPMSPHYPQKLSVHAREFPIIT